MMPNMNGHELITKIKDAGYNVPTIILTARTDEYTKINMLTLGVDDYITKPFNEDELKLKVKHLIHNNAQRINYAKEIGETIKDSVDQEFLATLNQTIQSNIQESKFSLEDLADALSVSPRSLQRKVKLLTGLSPKQYTMSMRLQIAREFIEQKPTASLKEVAYSVGISNQTRFVKQYEEYFGKKL